jgi:uncharacterized caspase-like protein
MKVIRILACLAVALWAGAGMAQDAKKNFALVIGNSDYPWPGAAGARNNSSIMAESLKALGFEVHDFENLNQRGMRRALLDFQEVLRDRGKDSVAFVYFAGLAVQMSGQNYLVPVGEKIDTSRDLGFEAMSLSTVIHVLHDNVQTSGLVVVIDVTLRNPFPFVHQAGLAKIGAPAGGLIVFSAAPGTEVSSDTRSSSLFTTALTKAIAVKGVKIEDVLSAVGRNVASQTHGAQTPWQVSALTGKLYLAGTLNFADCAALNPPPACFWGDKQ